MSIGSLSKAIGPLLGAIFFAWTLSDGFIPPFDYHFTFIIIAIFTIVMAAMSLPSEDNTQSDVEDDLTKNENKTNSEPDNGVEMSNLEISDSSDHIIEQPHDSVTVVENPLQSQRYMRLEA